MWSTGAALLDTMYSITISEVTGLNDVYDFRRTNEPAELDNADNYQVSDGVRKVVVEQHLHW